MKYLIIIEKTGNGYSAYLPDVPGCVAAGKTADEVKKNIAGALTMHLEVLAEGGEPIPKPRARADYVAI